MREREQSIVLLCLFFSSNRTDNTRTRLDDVTYIDQTEKKEEDEAEEKVLYKHIPFARENEQYKQINDGWIKESKSTSCCGWCCC